MSRKRRNTSSPEPDGSSPVKRPYYWSDSEEEDADEVPYVDQASGQVGAFPGLGEDRGELFYGPACDGVDYLRMVRSEAKGVPSIITAQISATRLDVLEEKQELEQGGYYFDGAYTALKQTLPSVEVEAKPSLPSAQIHYYDSLLAHFRLARATLRCPPPLSAVEVLRSSQFISFPANTRKVQKQWEQHMVSTDPHPVQVACMDADTIVELVRFLSEKLHKMLHTRDPARITRVGAWTWAVLGKCRDRGELSSEEIGDIRKLAQRALWLQDVGDERHGTEAEEEEEEEEGEAENESPNENPDAGTNDITEETTTLENGHGEAELVEGIDDSNRNHRVILDMIVTIAGEVYGQRDLLDLRSRWTD
ncbi:hypothetical protein AYO20_08512 [Fonsecaea nubica]|uniref:Uncharacterized protein n=1 Tax=Fonsecaea nubica TaxID=856822 RepID=A0A178CN61_9EURO|nr:hypothetical protein AYO20_08512 [Fonsecaea nubica]OAL30927.1 hypothetical protein AYO20_08512 [Fonsecaea nubica]